MKNPGSHISMSTKVPANAGRQVTSARPLSSGGTPFNGAGHFSYDHEVPLLTPRDDEPGERDNAYPKHGPSQSIG